MSLHVPTVLVANYRLRTAMLTAAAMLAFAGNSILCRLALRSTSIEPASFTAARIGSAALALWVFVPRNAGRHEGSWASALALFVYAVCFSFAYVEMAAGVGALVLFGAVQLTMIGWSLWQGERFNFLQLAGIATAILGLVMLLLPGVSTGPLSPVSIAMMLSAGVAWGVYSLRGRKITNPFEATRANFILAVPFAAVMFLASIPQALDLRGLALAAASGAITSAAGYMIWYSVLPRLTVAQASTVQLCVPAVAACLGFLLLGEALSMEQGIAAVAVFVGVSLTMRR